MTGDVIERVRPAPSFSLVRRAVQWAAQGIARGRLAVTLPGGEALEFCGAAPGTQAQMTIGTWRFLARVALGWDIGFAQSYLAGEWTSGDLSGLLRFMAENLTMGKSFRRLNAPPILRQFRHGRNGNTRNGSRRNIAAHYDLGNDFYAAWLDADMIYSAGIYTSPDSTLEDAQHEKCARIAELLGLGGGEDVLEVGCGWGALARRLAEHAGCRVHGLTLSQAQLVHARRIAAQSPAGALCTFELRDYRDSAGVYDRIVSVEMIEAVGEAYWPLYFKTLHDRLRPGGIAVVQAITIGEAHFDDYRRRPDFIQRYVFPGGMLPTKQVISAQAEAAGLTLERCETFGESYARTLGDWRARFSARWPAIAAMGFDARFERMWNFYLAYCQAGFETGVLDVGLYRFRRNA